MRYGWPRRLSSTLSYSYYAFSVTRPVRGTATPLFDVFRGNPFERVKAADRFSSEFVEYSTNSAKINDLGVLKAVFGSSRILGLSQ
jgi:hypothetical protein